MDGLLRRIGTERSACRKNDPQGYQTLDGTLAWPVRGSLGWLDSLTADRCVRGIEGATLGPSFPSSERIVEPLPFGFGGDEELELTEFSSHDALR